MIEKEELYFNNFGEKEPESEDDLKSASDITEVDNYYLMGIEKQKYIFNKIKELAK